MSDIIEPPRLSEPELLPPLSIHALASKDEYSRCLIEGALIEYQEAERVAFDQVVFKNVTITESSLQRIELTDVIFDHCDLSNVDFSDAFMHRTVFRDCRLTGTDFTGARFQNVAVTDCIGEYAVFRFAQFKGASFERCSLVSADYYQSSLKGLTFAECNLEQATLAGCKLKGVDLSDCEFTGLLVDLEDLDGCIISAEQAASLPDCLDLLLSSGPLAGLQGNQLQLAGAAAAAVTSRIGSALAQVLVGTGDAHQLIAVRLRLAGLGARQSLAVTAAADAGEQCFEIGIPVHIPPLRQMQVVVAELMLDDFLRLLPPVGGKLPGVNLYIMAFGEIPSACGRESAVEAGRMPERHAEAVQRHLLNPLLQLFVAHTGHSVPSRSSLPEFRSLLEL